VGCPRGCHAFQGFSEDSAFDVHIAEVLVAQLYSQKVLNGIVANMPGVHNEVKSEARRIGRIAEVRLDSARASTQWFKIADPGNKTKITVEDGAVDAFVNLEAYKMGAMALEYGHAPSGVFGPGGRLSHVKTKAPFGLYIMTGAYIQA
jgi:hypothetical protein